MDRTRKLYFAFMLISVFLVSTMCFSYAFFTSKTEGNGKLNIVAGTLDYKIESVDLENDKITIAANEVKEINIKLYSLNDIDSKYELYYTQDSTNDSFRVGYDIDTKDSVLGTIGANSSKTITLVARNESSEDVTISFDVIGGLTNNELTLAKGNSLNQVVGKYTAYSIGEEITLIDGSKWHVLESSSETDENVVLLSDYNLNSDGTYNDECGRDVNSTYKCSTMLFDYNGNNIYNITDENNIGYFIANTYAPLVKEKISDVTDISLPTAEQIALIYDIPFNETSTDSYTIDDSWVTTTNYWTRSTNNQYPWTVYGERLSLVPGNPATSSVRGARPTITTPKSNIVEVMSSTSELAIGTAVEAVDGSKWHVLEASGSDSKYVTLLSDYNLNSDGTYNTECGRDINGQYFCGPMSFDVDGTGTYDETDSNNIGYFIKNTYEPLVSGSLLETTNVSLPEASQIAIADGQAFNQENLTLSVQWLLTTNYWTRTNHVSYYDFAWYVSSDTSPSYILTTFANTSVYFGARPVITTLKTNLKEQ